MNSELRKDCTMRHENGNCMPAGGFCTANNDCICKALHNAYADGYADGQRYRWISVDDALPEEFENVIVANKRGKIFDIDKAWWNGSVFARCGKPNYYKVTHWMPLPEPPVENA